MKGRGSTLVYLVLVVLVVLAFARVQQVASQNNNARKHDHTQFCAVSIQRWIVQHDVIRGIGKPLRLPSGPVDAIARTIARNDQVAAESAKLLVELGPKPQPC